MNRLYGFITDSKEAKPCGYFPAGKNWHVRYSAPDENGLMTGVIIQNGEELAVRDQPSTVAELKYFAEAYMAARNEA
jgi:hypothetical protein